MNKLLDEGLEETFIKFLMPPPPWHDTHLLRNRFFRSACYTGLASVQLIHMVYIKDDLTPEQTKSLWPEEIKELAAAFGALDENQLSELYGRLPWDGEGNFVGTEDDPWLDLQFDMNRMQVWG
ncbi:hypothetical protein A0H81_00381 [Grifola frondosa]|uniref:Uncharacterized protein n=1 Tax=Grifola frondosa TaxID=5627 RepID=A0A1C7MS41_GRIFR|nr:hypothetical protein A0H81_00381 [Grifola frondosa]